MDEQRGLSEAAVAAGRGARIAQCCGRVLSAGGTRIAALRRREVLVPVAADRVSRGVALRGWVWPGGDHDGYAGVVVVGPDGTVAAMGPTKSLALPEGLRVLDVGWVGPGVVDAHVHVAFGARGDILAGGVVAVRDLGAPPVLAEDWQTTRDRLAGPGVAVSGPLLTRVGGYPSTSWGADGFSLFLAEPETIRAVVSELARDGVDLIKIALERGDGGLPVPSPDQVRAVVRAAHEAGLSVTAHALTLDMVGRALDAGVDELAHTPVEVLPADMVERIATAGLPVVSTLQTFYAGGSGRGPGINASALHAAGVPLLYGTDLGNAGTRPGVDPRELDRLADAGLGRRGALRAATEGSARAAGLHGRGGDGRLAVGAPARLVGLASDPLVEPAAWRRPLAVVTGDRVLVAADDAGLAGRTERLPA